MTETLNAAGALLTASVEDRTLTYRLLPYGEEGRTSLGKVVASKGSVTIPEDVSRVTLNMEHEYKRPVGRAVNITEDEDGLLATFKIAATSAGNDLLAEAQEGLRSAVSVEIESPVIRAGRLISGLLTAAGAVVRPAFASALLMAEDTGETTDSPETEPEETEENNNDSEGSNMSELNAAAPAGLPLPGAGNEGLKIETSGDLFAAVAKANETNDRRLFAALADVTESGIGSDITVPQYVGELWSGVGYSRQYVSLFNHAELTSHRVNGWRWVTKPEVASYAGNKAEVPTNAVSTEPVVVNAERIAGAHDIDRRFRDFNDQSFFESYYKAMTESYAEVSDLTVLQAVLNGATDYAVTGLEVGSAGTPETIALAALVEAYFRILEGTRRTPTFALVDSTTYRRFLFTTNDNVNPYLESLLGIGNGSLTEGFLRPSADLAEGTFLMGVKDAVTVHELGGGAPIRVEALDVARGGVDAGVFGYLAVNVHNENGLIHGNLNSAA